MADERLSDDEIVYRRILKKDVKQNRIPRNQFKLRSNEEGISVNRAALITRTNVIAKGNSSFEYLLAQATIGDIRQLLADDGTHLRLDVIPTHTDEDPSHAEIRGPVIGTLPEGAPLPLARLIQVEFPVAIDDGVKGHSWP